MNQKQISKDPIKITVEKILDESPDLSYLEDPKMQGLDKRDFIAHCLTCHKEKLWQDDKECYSCKSTLMEKRRQTKEELQDALEENRKRLESYGDHWVMIGIVASCRVPIKNIKLYPERYNESETTEELRSRGLWGIESDAKNYHEEVIKEEVEDLKDQLRELGYNTDNVVIVEEGDF